MTIIVAIDGPTASGKGTLARRLAGHMGLRHLDSGLIYRATAARVLAAGASPRDEAAAAACARRLREADLEQDGLRRQEIGRAASILAVHGAVRRALIGFQRRFAARPPGAAIDGRDIGTVVCPGAQAKLFVTASLEARARRRWAELRARGEAAALRQVADELAERDRRDSERALAPLCQAADAVVLDTTHLDAEAAFARALAAVEERLKAPRHGSIQAAGDDPVPGAGWGAASRRRDGDRIPGGRHRRPLPRNHRETP